MNLLNLLLQYCTVHNHTQEKVKITYSLQAPGTLRETYFLERKKERTLFCEFILRKKWLHQTH